MKSDAIGRLNYERETARNSTLSVIPVEKVEVATEQMKQEALKDADEETKKTIDDDRVFKVEEPEFNDKTIDSIIDNTDAIRNMEETKVEEITTKIENETKEEQVKMTKDLNEIDNALINMAISHQRIAQYDPETFKQKDTPVSKDDDEVIRNMNKIESSADIYNKSIHNYSDLIYAAIDIGPNTTIRDLFIINDVRNKELQKIFAEKVALLGYDEMYNPEKSEQYKSAIYRMAVESMGEMMKGLDINRIREIARKSFSTEDFKANVKKLTTDIGFTSEFADVIIKNSFGDVDIYMYNMNRSVEKQRFVNIDANGKIEFSEENDAPFLDKNGNDNHLYRLS